MSLLIAPALISSVVEVCVTQPIDVIKIHYQTSTPIKYNFSNLYAGLYPRAFGNIPSRTIFLFTQDYLKQSIESNGHPLLSFYSPLLVPLGTSFMQTLVDTPTEVLKMNQIMKIKNTHLYKGFMSHLNRNFIFLLSVYNFRQYGENNLITNNIVLNNSIYGSIGGVIGSYVSHPFDTVKTFAQTNKDVTGLTFGNLFKGCHMRASMSMINMFISLYIFEFIKKKNIF